MVPDDALRIGHAERDRAVEALREAAGDGRLTLGELDGRIEGALAARTRADLRPLLADLLSPAAVEQLVRNQDVVPFVGGPGFSWQDPLVLTARWEDVVRAGPWEVPPFLELNAVAGNVRLNFVDARMAGDLIDVSIVGGAGNVVLVVPEGWGVDTSRMGKGFGSVRSSVSPRPVPGRPLLVARGSLSLGNLKIRHPNSLDRWLRERRLASGGGLVVKN